MTIEQYEVITIAAAAWPTIDKLVEEAIQNRKPYDNGKRESISIFGENISLKILENGRYDVSIQYRRHEDSHNVSMDSVKRMVFDLANQAFLRKVRQWQRGY